ncbi:MAG TPA: carbohydrate ABC transporter permease [Clostridia bacterium]|nr:carbohydrate ABC transporter permease [Clostridia bacterium]
MVKSSGMDRAFDALVIALLGVLLLAVLYPLYFVVIASLSDPLLVMSGKVIWKTGGATLEAYRLVFRNSLVLSGYRNTLAYTGVGTLLNLLMTVCAAYPLSRGRLRGKQFFLGMMMITMFFSGGMIPSYVMINRMKLLDTFWVMILPNALSVWNVMIMRTFFASSIPRELEEAALVDGADHLRTLRSVILPLSKPILAVMVVFYAVAHWNSYFNGLIYLSSQSKFPLQLVLRAILIQNQMPEEMFLDVGDTYSRQLMSETLKYALIVVASIPVLCLYPFAQRFFVQGVMIGSVKG